MRQIKTIAALVLLASLAAGAAQAQNWNGATNYNGYGASTMNTSSNYSMRDANGNLTMVNGQLVGSNYSQTSEVGGVGGVGGIGTQGATSTYAQATAIGNSLNVEVVGTHNTTIIDTTQVNNGDQTATNTLSH
jgi:holdfast attachment protein HfaA